MPAPLQSVLLWLDQDPSRYWSLVATTGMVVLLSALLAALRPASTVRWNPPWLFGALLAVMLLAGRWPAILDNTQANNPDESQMIAGAIVLKSDPVFWKSVDGNTTGPLAQWPLAFLGACGLPLDYTTARLFSTALMWVVLVTSWLSLRVIFGDGVARVLVLPATVLQTTTPFWDFLQYSSEHMPMALLSTAGWLLVVELHTPAPPNRSPWRLWIAGMLLACGPFAKLQSGPLGLWLGVSGLVLVAFDSRLSPLRRLHRAIWLGSGALAVPAAFAVMVSANHIWPDFWEAYIQSNLDYTGRFLPGWRASGENFLRLIHDSTGFSLYFYPAVATLAGATLLGAFAKNRATRLFLVITTGLLLIGAFSVALPDRSSTHYVQLMIGPALLTTGAAVGALLQFFGERGPAGSPLSRLAVAGVIGLFLYVGLGRQVAYCREFTPPNLGRFSLTRGTLSTSPESDFLRRTTHPEDRIATWGWMPRYLVEAARGHATRETVTAYAIYDSPMREFFRQRYLNDFLRTRPSYFMDMVGPGSFAFEDRHRYGHETFEPLAAEIAAHYRLVAEVGSSRIYARTIQ